MCFVSGVLRFLQTLRGTQSLVAAKNCSSGPSADGVACERADIASSMHDTTLERVNAL